VSGQQSLKVFDILGAAGNCLHHQQIFNTRKSYPDATDVMILTAGNGQIASAQSASGRTANASTSRLSRGRPSTEAATPPIIMEGM